MKKIYYILLLVSLSMVSCKEYLDIKPYGKTVPQSTEEFSALLHNICNGIDVGSTGVSEIIGDYSLTAQYEEVVDNMDANLTSGTDRMNFYIGQLLNGKMSSYTNLYQQIRDCNIILGYMNEGRDTREGMDILGATYAIRGVCYYQLMRQFCAPPLADDAVLGMPLVTEFDMEGKPARSTIQETINQIESDFKTALSYDIQEEMYRFNNDVINAYLARLYFWCGRWEEARQLADSLLVKYPLVDGETYSAMMTTTYGLAGNRIIMGNRLAGNNQLGLSGTMATLENRPLSANYENLYANEGTRDVRYRMFSNRKRKNKKVIFSGIRSAELALMSMECNAHLGDSVTALSQLNAFRKCRITGMYIYNFKTLPAPPESELVKEDAMGKPLSRLMYAILAERRKEFYLENGDRWFELKRNGRPEWSVYSQGYKYTTEKYMYTFPIPLRDIQLNPTLEQNPGYTETM